MVLPCVQNSPRKTGEARTAGLTHVKAAHRSSRTSLSNYITNLARFWLGVEPAELWSIWGICNFKTLQFGHSQSLSKNKDEILYSNHF